MIIEEIPLIEGAADQTADIVLSGIPFTIRVLWNERFQYWALSLYERAGVALVLNVKMVNDFPLLKRYHAVILPGDLFFFHRGGKTYRPGFDDVGAGYGLYYIDPQTPSDLPVPIAPLN